MDDAQEVRGEPQRRKLQRCCASTPDLTAAARCFQHTREPPWDTFQYLVPNASHNLKQCPVLRNIYFPSRQQILVRVFRYLT